MSPQVSLEERQREIRHTGGVSVKTETEIGGMWSQSKKYWQPPEAEEARNGSLLESLKSVGLLTP